MITMVADQTWKDAQQNYNEQKVKADALNDKAIQYIITRQEADDSRTLYEDLLKRLKEAGILQGLKSNTITVVDQALIPIKPKKPNVPLYLAAALAFGLFLGGAGVLVVDTLDNTIQDASAIEQMGLPLLGVLPKFGKPAARAIEVLANPKSRYSETVRNLRSVLTRVKNAAPPKVILITSAIPGEGKTTLSMNLAASFVQQGKTVLLLEADMRRPAIRSQHGIARQKWIEPLACRRIARKCDLRSSRRCPGSTCCRKDPFQPFPRSCWSPIVCVSS